MSRTQHLRALANDPRTPKGEAEAARRALARHEHRLQTAIEEPEPLPPGPDLTRRGSPFPAKVDGDGRVWVAVRQGEATAREWVDARRRMLVRIGGERFAVIPTAVEPDDERQQVWVTADRDSLAEW